jgi:hypothetical protein
MGYSTDFDITDNSLEVQAAIEIVSGYDYFQDIKWYDWEADAKTVSSKFPEEVIKIYGEGEEPRDIWKAYIKNGKSFITQAALMFEDFDESKLQ